jgi:hypothetical protein
MHIKQVKQQCRLMAGRCKHNENCQYFIFFATIISAILGTCNAPDNFLIQQQNDCWFSITLHYEVFIVKFIFFSMHFYKISKWQTTSFISCH